MQKEIGIASENDKGTKRKVLKTAYRRAAKYGRLWEKLFFWPPPWQI